MRSAEWAAMRFLRLLSARGQPERLKEKRWDIGVSQRGSRGGEEDPPRSTQARLDPSRDKPAVRGIVPGDVAAAVTARGGAAEQRKQSVRTESKAHLPGQPPRWSLLRRVANICS